MAVVRLLKSLCILVPLLLAARPAKAAPARVALVGIFHDTGDSPSAQSKFLTDGVTTRLRILGFEFASVPKSATPCRSAECLSPLLREVGADLAMTGIVFRTHDLCTASLYVQDLKGAAPRSEDIRCQPDTGDEVLAGEFAEMAGRLSESSSREKIAAPSAGADAAYLSKLAVPMSVDKQIWPWTWKRKAVVVAIGVSLGLSVIAAISITGYLGGNTTIERRTVEGGFISNEIVSNRTYKPDLLSSESATWSLVGVSTLALSVTIAIPANQR